MRTGRECGAFSDASTPQLQQHLSGILTVMGKMYLQQYKSQINNEDKRNKGKCTAAIALIEQALSILRTLLQDGFKVSQTSMLLASAHSYLDVFKEAHGTLKEALDLIRSCSGEKSTRVASFHQQMEKQH